MAKMHEANQPNTAMLNLPMRKTRALRTPCAVQVDKHSKELLGGKPMVRLCLQYVMRRSDGHGDTYSLQ